MRLPSHKLLLAAGVIGVVLVVGMVAAIADNVGLALVCVLLIQSAALLAVVDTRRRQGGLADTVNDHAASLKRVDRTIANVSQRVVTEARASDKALRTELAASRADLRDRLGRTRKGVERTLDLRVQDIEAMIQLSDRFELRAAMPPSGRWALNAGGLLKLVDLVERRPIRTIVELGSGTSTLWLSYALERRGSGGRIISLDHDPHFAGVTRAELVAHGFADGPAEVRDAPLVDGVIDGHDTPWYDPASFHDVEAIDLLIVDGPPMASGGLARYPAVPMLLSRLAPGAIVVVDDAPRPDEQEMMQRWLADVPGLTRVDQTERQVFLALGE